MNEKSISLNGKLITVREALETVEALQQQIELEQEIEAKKADKKLFSKLTKSLTDNNPFMKHDFFKYVKAVHFFNSYAPSVKNWTKKITGTVVGTKVVAFTPEDLEAIQKGKEKYYRDLTTKKHL